MPMGEDVKTPQGLSPWHPLTLWDYHTGHKNYVECLTIIQEEIKTLDVLLQEDVGRPQPCELHPAHLQLDHKKKQGLMA